MVALEKFFETVWLGQNKFDDFDRTSQRVWVTARQHLFERLFHEVMIACNRRLHPENNKHRDSDGRQKIPPELVVTGGDPSEILDAAEGVLDQMPFSVSRLVVGNLPLAVRPAGNNGPCSLLTQGFAKRVCIVALVGDEMLRAAQIVRKQFGGPHVAHVAGREAQREWAPDHVGEDMDFACLTAARWADALRFRPPLPPKAERCAFT